MSYYDNAAPSGSTYGNRPGQQMRSSSENRPPREPRDYPDTSKMSPEELFSYRKDFRLNFGKFRGMTLNEVASLEDGGDQIGLTYLHWLNSIMNDETWPPLREAVTVFVNHPLVKADIDAAMAARTKATPKGRY